MVIHLARDVKSLYDIILRILKTEGCCAVESCYDCYVKRLDAIRR